MSRWTGKYPVSLYVGTITGTTDSGRVIPLWTAPSEHKVEITNFGVKGIWTYNAANYMGYLLKRGSDANTIATVNTNAANGTVTSARTGSISTSGYAIIAAGGTVYLSVSQTASGLTATEVEVTFEYEYVR